MAEKYQDKSTLYCFLMREKTLHKPNTKIFTTNSILAWIVIVFPYSKLGSYSHFEGMNK